MRLLTVKQVREMLQTNPKVREEELEKFLIEEETQQNDYHTKL